MIFALQQFTEGFVWLSLKKETVYLNGLAFLYLFFAYSLWPILCPLSVYALEYGKKRKKALLFLTLLGAVTSLYLLFFISAHPVKVYTLDHHLRYKTFVPGASLFALIYTLATILPYFISSHKKILVFGIPNLIFCFAAYFFYEMNFTSVWCFFAAILSLTLYVFLKKLHHEPVLPLIQPEHQP